MSTEGAALAAASIFALNDHRIWAKLRAKKLNTIVSLKADDKAMCESS